MCTCTRIESESEPSESRRRRHCSVSLSCGGVKSVRVVRAGIISGWNERNEDGESSGKSVCKFLLFSIVYTSSLSWFAVYLMWIWILETYGNLFVISVPSSFITLLGYITLLFFVARSAFNLWPKNIRFVFCFTCNYNSWLVYCASYRLFTVDKGIVCLF